MKKYTQEEFDAFEVDEYGYKICPTGDYTEIKSFGEWCSFGERCSFGEGCSFGERCRFGERCSCEFGEFSKMLTIGGFGSEARTTYFFLLTTGKALYVRCGCFRGTYDEWINKVQETHQNSKFARAYLAAGEAVKIMCEEG